MKLPIIGEDDEELNDLRSLVGNLSRVGFIEVEKAYYVQPPRGLDALFLTLPAAERWSPDFKSRKAQILNTSLEEQRDGYPPFIITGVNLAPDGPRDLASQLKLLLRKVLEASEESEQRAELKIENLGFWAMDLTRCATTRQVSEFLHELLPNLPEAS